MRAEQAAVLTLLWLAGCGRGHGLSAELAALRDDGLAVGEFRAVADPGPLRARACTSGTVERVAALLCEYAGADAASLGQAGAEAWVGQAITGVVLRRDLFLLALADRDQADLHGKAIVKIRQAFQRPRR